MDVVVGVVWVLRVCCLAFEPLVARTLLADGLGSLLLLDLGVLMRVSKSVCKGCGSAKGRGKVKLSTRWKAEARMCRGASSAALEPQTTTVFAA